MSEVLIEHYRKIIPDSNHLEVILKKPMPFCFWVNTLKTTNEKVLRHLQKLGIEVEPIVWHPNAFRTYSKELGRSWVYLFGLIQIQEEVSMLPGMLLDAKPGEMILDLCSAPGNKTAQTSVAMKNQGTLIANDIDFSRMKAMGQIKKRLGLLNLSLSIYDAMKYPGLKNQFDRVLVDAPCGCEGTLRKSARTEFKPSRYNALKMAHRQLLILKKAFQLCKPGGHIVYSTCTFAPEENERVVHELLQEVGDQVRVLPINLENFKFSKGVTEWENETFDPQLKNTMRVWPHQNNTGGFFVAVLQKKRGQVFDCRFSGKITSKKVAIKDLTSLARFGFEDSLFNNFYFTESTKGFYMVPKSAQPPEGIRYDSTGLFFLKTRILFPKLSTQAAMVFGKYATKHVIHLNETQFKAYLEREEFVLGEQQIKRCESTGYVILFYEAESIGCGLYFSARGDQPPRCRSLLPKFLNPQGQNRHQGQAANRD